jgi:hypothetical protein
MKSVLLPLTLLLVSGGHSSVQLPSPTLPELHKIKAVTLSPSYSCRSKEDFQKGYGNTALFLTDEGRWHGPDLLFNGACGSLDYLQGQTAGDDMTLIADLGRVSLEDLRADQAFNVKRIASNELYSRFMSVAEIEVGHTYAVVINKSGVRGLIFISITAWVPNQKLDLKYVVKEYQLLIVRKQSPGFDWTKRSE